jgi:colicin import membrane protein
VSSKRLNNARAMLFAVALHVIAVALLTVSLRFDSPAVVPASKPSQVMNAVAVNRKDVEAEVKRLKEIDQKKREVEKQRERELEKKARDLEKKRIEEEKKVEQLKQEQKEAETRKRQEQEERARIEEEKKIAIAEKEKAEAEKKRQDEERRRAEEEKQKAIDEKKRIEEEDKRRKEEERKQAVEEKRRAEEEQLEKQRQEELAAEEQARQAEQQEQSDLGVINEYVAKIQAKVQSVFINPNPGERLKCKLFVRMSPAGDVIDARVEASSGVPAFDRQAEVALRKASPLPVPSDARIFDKMREIHFEFEPEG